jgi:hypothetical protein
VGVQTLRATVEAGGPLINMSTFLPFYQSIHLGLSFFIDLKYQFFIDLSPIDLSGRLKTT